MQVLDIYLTDTTRAFDRAYTYLPPDRDLQGLEVGALVTVPFGRGDSVRTGWIWRIRETEETFTYPLKRILELKSASLLRPDQFQLAKEIRRRYFCSISQALRLMAPQALLAAGAKTRRFARLTDPEEAQDLLEEGGLRSLNHVRVLEFLLDVEEASLEEIMASCQVSRAILNTLRKNGFLQFFSREVARASTELPCLEEAKQHILNSDQAKALEGILAPGESQEVWQEFLLYGVTGSGKTEVYLRAAEEVLSQGKDVIILVPEISLTPLICSRIQARFGQSAAIIHSRLTPAERYEQWRSIRSGEKHLVAGARSAIFAPLAKLGLIVIDEEQESSYKSERTPRYDALEIARLRAALHGAKLVLSSATPSLVSYHRAQSGKSRLLRLPRRAGPASLPSTRLVDMRQGSARGGQAYLSGPLRQALAASFARGEQAMVLLNRRGQASFLLCPDCGYTARCPNCDISMTVHHNPRRPQQEALICHYCGLIQVLPSLCPECNSDRLSPFGIGTQKALAILEEAFPEQRFLRMDFDTTVSRQGHAKILAQFAQGEADCLVGTQMIAKGHDFGRVTTVGIMSADSSLALDDYQAEEKAFQLICQAAGRAGRHDLPGQVIIQSFQPDHPAIIAAAQQDYQAFYDHEIFKRKILQYPPFQDLGLVLISSLSLEKAKERAGQIFTELSYLLRKNALEDQVLLYPDQASPIARIRKRWRFRIILKCARRDLLTQVLTYVADLDQVPGVSVNCDINPLRLT
ncbi:MAG: primosomal protein N' [Eubacteriales bacterium]|nr:primosomal protein N' [Eubacteriales bacterium]